MMMKIAFVAFFFLTFSIKFSSNHENNHENKATTSLNDNRECDSEQEICLKPEYSEQQTSRSNLNVAYLFYDVNRPEGFNLRRDVYMRVAALVDYLNRHSNGVNWVLVLPPWANLYHWKSKSVSQNKFKWSSFFDLESLNKFVPVIELEDLLKIKGNTVEIDIVYYLENDFTDLNKGQFESFKLMDECPEDARDYVKDAKSNKIYGPFWGYGDEIHARQLKCVAYRGTVVNMADKALNRIKKSKSIMIDRAEVMLHANYGQPEYWRCRRSMKFAHHLKAKADEIRAKYLDSSDVKDDTSLNIDWTLNQVERSKNRGGPYLGVHLRRADFIQLRESHTVTIEHAAKQIKHALNVFNLTRVYIATDGTKQELDDLKQKLKEYTVVKYAPNEDDLKRFGDGGVAIIEQIICSHSRYFIGTKESTYSFRIQEEREILGFVASRTFNSFCHESDNKPCKTSKWLIEY